MIRQMVEKSVALKFMVVITAILLVSTTASIVLIARFEQAVLRQSLEEKGKSLISYIAIISKEPLLMKDSIQLDGIVHDVNRDEEVVYAVIRDQTGNLLTSRFSSLNPQMAEVKAVTAESAKDDLQELMAAIKKSGTITELSVPIMMEQANLGTATIGMSDYRIGRQIARTVTFVVLVNLATAALLGLAFYTASRRLIIKPITKLTEISKLVAAGDLSRTVEATNRDEIGELGRATGKMIADLRELISGIRLTATKTMSASEQILLGSRQVQQGALGTSGAAEETFVSMEQMAASIKSVSSSASTLTANVEQTSSSVTEMMASVENVARNMSELSSSVTQTSSTVEEMTVSIENVAKEAEELSTVVHETAAGVEQMTRSIEAVDQHVQEAGRLAKRSVEEAAAGGQALSRSFDGMKNISSTMTNMAELIQNLGARSLEIGKILEVMDEIADQTNLLALNASIQAAQAGEAGRGFAVVATQIRELAERSRSSAKEIGVVIKRVQQQTQEAVKSTEAGARESTQAMEMADRAAEALNRITQEVEKTNEIMFQITKATAEQRTGSKGVLDFVNAMRNSSDQMKRAMIEQATGGRQIRLAVETMNRIMQDVERAAQEQVRGSKQIVVAVETMRKMTYQVSNATGEQTQGGTLVVKAMQNISTIAKENLAAVEKMATSSEQLVADSQALLKNVESFRV